jgi:uncharacterized protein (DUF433 family)
LKTLSHSASAPEIGAGIFLTKDIATILHLPLPRVRHWLNEFWDKRFSDGKHSFGTGNTKAVNFYTLIEFYTFYQLRDNGFSAQEIQKAYHIIAKDLDTKYPFAKDIIKIDEKDIWYEYLGELMKVDFKRKLYLKQLLEPFLHKIDYDEDAIAERYYPLGRDKKVIVDPKHQFGQPTILGTNVKIQTVYNLHLGGETDKNICILYDLSEDEVKDAIKFYLKAA